MMIKKLFAALFAAVGILSAAAAVYIGINCTDREPQLLTQPTVARNKVVMMMNAVCDGDYEQASLAILGTPSLGVDRDPADEVGILIWEAYQQSLSFELVGECYTTEDGLAQNVILTAMDIESVTVNLKERSQILLEQRVQEAEDISEVYDENNEYRESFVMEVLYDAAKQALEEDAVEYTVELTLKLRYQDGSWWVLADSALLDAISGGILY
jgi:hypothetical protein